MPPSPSPRPHGTEPPIRDRGDACPGALRLHSAADGHLARVRLPMRRLDGASGRSVGRCRGPARRRPSLAHLPRQRGTPRPPGRLRRPARRPAARRRSAPLRAPRTHPQHPRLPLAGLDRHTPADVRLWARDLDQLLCASNSTTALSGRFLFVLDDGRGDVATLGGDVSLVAEGAGGCRAPGARTGPGAAPCCGSATIRRRCGLPGRTSRAQRSPQPRPSWPPPRRAAAAPGGYVNSPTGMA